MGAEDYAPDSLPAAQHLLNDLHLNNAENQGANTDKAASAKTHKEHAEELKNYIKKRIELFDQYKSREDAQVYHLSDKSSTGTVQKPASVMEASKELFCACVQSVCTKFHCSSQASWAVSGVSLEVHPLLMAS